MRFRGLYVLLATAVLLGCFWLACPARPASPADLSAGFVGLTNDPGASVYPRLSVLGDGRGLYALFAMTNISQGPYIRFGLTAVETQAGDGWRADTNGVFEPALGSVWPPGHSCLYAIPWPAKVMIGKPWRLSLWVMREPKLILVSINQRFGREIFRPYGRHSVTSEVVSAMTLRFTVPKADVENAQSNRVTNESFSVGH